jgi:uncharacterized protein YcbX
MPSTVLSLRRYPVKSMGGEDLARADLDARGIEGDRWYAVRDDDGRFASGKNTRRFRRRDGVFAYSAATEPDGAVLVSSAGQSWHVGDPHLDQNLTAALGVPVRVAPEGDVRHQDQGSVSLVGTATLRWCAERWGGSPDPRRLRVNIVCETAEPFEEETWVGSTLQAGTARLRVVERIPRCRTVDIVQDGVDPVRGWLKPLGEERDLCVAVYADVVAPGTVAVGDGLVVAGQSAA